MGTETVSISRTILIVEDDEDIGAFLVQAITNETSYKALLARHGFEALKVAREIKPDLLILDYQLPGMNGLELYDRLQAIEDREAVPAIMMSALLPTRELDVREIFGIRKPFELQDLFDAIEKLLHPGVPKNCR